MDFATQLKASMLAIGKDAQMPVEVVGDAIIVSYDEFEECTLTPVNGGEAVEFQAPLLAFGPDNRDALFAEALRLSLYGSPGVAVGLSDKVPVLLLRKRVPAAGLHQRELSEQLTGFIDLTRAVRERVASAGGDSAKPDTTLHTIDLVIMRA
jgi:hypothetical protein